ncbi:MAG: gamma-glutamyl phosphate reductase [Rhodospirillaceae bacterium]|nr:gamma-glutamyl phosphate reductase [Rhodospirillaceae bacterium]
MAVEILAGPVVQGDWRAGLHAVAAAGPLAPFSAEAAAFTRALSLAILRDHAMQAYPELMALAHWLRPAHVEEMRRDFECRNQGRVRRARGLAVHFAPANVDTLFVYSWVVSLLAGNAGVLRLSTRTGPQLDVLLGILGRCLDDETHGAVRQRLLVVRYPHDDAVSAELSRVCDVRVIWGGDDTVRALRSLPLPPRAVDLAFGDRLSAAVLSARAILAAAGADWAAVVDGFANDAFWFDQQACASPRLVVWTGSQQQAAEARERFWPAVQAVVAARGWSLLPAQQMARLTAAHAMAAAGGAASLEPGTAAGPARLALRRWDATLGDLHGGNGLFLEMTVPGLGQAFALFDRKVQTVGVHGFDRGEIEQALGRLPAGAVDRIVPVGEALAFDYVWDGSDLFDQFTREVAIRVGGCGAASAG